MWDLSARKLCISELLLLARSLLNRHLSLVGLLEAACTAPSSLLAGHIMAPHTFVGDQNGYWERPTSTIDWCEENYAVTHYIAEFWNSVTNVVLIVPPIIGIIYYSKHGIEFRFIAMHLALAAVGIGSWLFHMTLKYEMQLMDELPMIFGTSLLTYVMHWNCRGCEKDRATDIAILVAYCTTVSLVYLVLRNPIFHQAAYACLVFLFMYKTVEASRKMPAIKNCVLTSFILYAIAFAIWNIDNMFCGYIRRARGNMSPYVAPLIQLHGWWHIFVGLASWMHATIALHARCISKEKSCSLKVLWHVFPYLEFHDKYV